MSLHVLDVSIPGSTPATNPVTFNFELGEAFIRKVHVNSEGAGTVGLRVSHNGLTLFPWLGAGLSAWLSMVNLFYVTFEDFRRLSGPPYALTLEAYNTAGTAKRLLLYFETQHTNYYPVNVLEVKEVNAPKSPQPTTPQAGY
jgi:hypothetical protein